MRRTSFRKDRIKRIMCPNCRGFLMYRRLNEPGDIFWTCIKCKKEWKLPNTKLFTKDGRKAVRFGPEGNGVELVFTFLDRKQISTDGPIAAHDGLAKMELEEVQDYELD